MSLKLCLEHKQEENYSHFDTINCDYCKLVSEVNRLQETLAMQEVLLPGEDKANQALCAVTERNLWRKAQLRIEAERDRYRKVLIPLLDRDCENGCACGECLVCCAHEALEVKSCPLA
jgi:hypothetical protein